MILKIYLNKTNEIIFEKLITQEILNQYDINVKSEDFTELFETEILSDIFDKNEYFDYKNINSSNT